MHDDNPLQLEHELVRAAELLAQACSVAVLTGAGISKESGIPTFREAQTGLWANYEPEKLATVEGFVKDPKLVWTWYDWRRKMVSSVKPNPGHFALVDLEEIVPKFTLITQNVDGLHRLAGSHNVIELHGNIARHKCLKYGHVATAVATDLPEPPRCDCGSFIRPDVVWFGEALDSQNLSDSFAAAESADVFLVVGTSGLVQPAASFPFVAQRSGAKLIEVNYEQTPLSRKADIFFEGASGVVLPRLVELMRR
ncbi:MAG: NAD-dependent deacylase [Candidatus Melainabacteria bacterium]|nr:NAD-dependent deacylase [Candidatus Melainabacteria bacterium]